MPFTLQYEYDEFPAFRRGGDKGGFLLCNSAGKDIASRSCLEI
jgi:hypothetical protein